MYIGPASKPANLQANLQANVQTNSCDHEPLHAELRVSELILPRGGGDLLNPQTKGMLKGLLPEARVSLQRAGGAAWKGAMVQSCLDSSSLFKSSAVPPVLAMCLEDAPGHAASLAAFSGVPLSLIRP